MGLIKLPKNFHPDFRQKGYPPKGEAILDTSNPLVEGLEAVYHCKGSGVDFLSPHGNIPATVSSGSIEFTHNPRGAGLTATASGTSTITDNDVPVPGTGDYTFFCHVYISNASSLYQYLIALDGSVGIACHTGGDFYFFHGGTLRSNVTFEAGRTYTVVGLRRAGVAYIYVDGIEQNSASSTGSISTRQLRLLSYNGGFSNEGVRHVMLAGYSLRGWSDAEVLSFQNDPYQLLKPVAPQVYFTPSVAGLQNLTATGITSQESIGSPTITTGSVDLATTGIASQESIGSPTVTTLTNLSASGIASEESFGSPVLTVGAVTLSATGIASEESFGSPTITLPAGTQNLSTTGIASTEAFGAAAISTGAVNLTVTGIPSEESFGSPTVVAATNVVLTATGIASLEAFGSPIVALAAEKIIKIDGLEEIVLNANLASTTLYYNGENYFTI